MGTIDERMGHALNLLPLLKFTAMIRYKMASKESELQWILDLQQRTLFSNVSQEEQRREVVAVTHRFVLQKRML